jgi:hypothetical protein
VSLLTSITIFEWCIESNDKIFEDKLALTLKKTCISINNYNNIFCQFSIYNYLNNKFLIIVNIVKKSLMNKVEKIYITNYENNYEKLLMSCFSNLTNFNNIIEPPTKYKDKKLNNIDEKIQKYISDFKKQN